MEKINVNDYAITKYSKEDIASFIEMIYKNKNFKSYIESISNFDEAKHKSALLSEFIIQYAISTGELNDEIINVIVSGFKEQYGEVHKSHNKNSRRSVKQELFENTVGPLIFDKWINKLNISIPLSMSDSVKILKAVKLSSYNNKFLTHSFNSVFLDDYIKNGIKLNNIFSNEVSNYIKLAGGNQPYKTGVLCTIELSESSFSYADIVPESVRNIYSANGDIMQDGESMHDYLLRCVNKNIGSQNFPDEEKEKIIADSKRVIDFYYGHNDNSIAVIDDNNGIISNDNITYFTIINSMLSYIDEYKKQTSKDERVDDIVINNLIATLKNELRNKNNNKDSLEKIDSLFNEIRDMDKGLLFVKGVKTYSLYNYICSSCLMNFEQSFGSGYEVEGGVLPKEKFAVATYESPVKYSSKYKNNLTEIIK